MAKQVTANVKLQCVGGQATPAPPVGPALGQHGVNIGKFVSEFNDRTKDMRGVTIPVVITVFSDRPSRSRRSRRRRPSAQAGRRHPDRKEEGRRPDPRRSESRAASTRASRSAAAQVPDIAKKKMNDLNARDVEHAARIVAGTARSMGLAVEG